MKISILEIDSIQKKYNYKILLSDIYIQCKTGEIIGLLGRNGSGKTTLFKIIFGIEKTDYKFIRINKEIKKKTSDLLKNISYLSQKNFIPFHLSVQKVIRLSVNKSQIEEFYEDETIQKVKYSMINEISGGELRYLEVKITLYNNSKFVLLDEPYSGLSPIVIKKINQLILNNSNKKGIIITDHNYDEIIKISTKLILLKDGKTFIIKDKEDLFEKGYLI